MFFQAAAVADEVDVVVFEVDEEVAAEAASAVDGAVVAAEEEGVGEGSEVADDSAVASTILCIVLSPLVVQEIAAFMT